MRRVWCGIKTGLVTVSILPSPPSSAGVGKRVGAASRSGVGFLVIVGGAGVVHIVLGLGMYRRETNAGPPQYHSPFVLRFVIAT